MPRILGREPALLLNLLAAAVALLSAFALHLTVDQQALINAAAVAIAGLVTAYMVGDGQVAAIMGAAQAVLALVVGFGLNVSSERQAVIMAFIAAVAAAWTRTQVVAPTPATSSGGE